MATNVRTRGRPHRAPRPRARCRSWPGGTSGCTSRAWVPTTDHEVPIIVRGEGCYVWDEHGKRYLDGLSALFCVNAGHGRAELGEAAAAPGHASSASTPTGATPTRAAIELAARIADLAPGDLNRVFFTSGGSEAVESAWKLARNYHHAARRGPAHQDHRARDRLPRHVARRARGDRPHRRCARRSSRSRPGGCHVPNTNSYRWPADRDPLWAADAIEERILFEGPETVAAVILEPVQNAGGCFVPQDGYFQRVREICDRYGVLLISDEVICSWGRLGHYFGCERYGYLPDIITTAKGLTSAYVPMGAMIVSDRIAEPFMEDKAMFAHGFTFGGHPVAAAVALANLDIFEREDLCGHVRAQGGRVPRHRSRACATSRSSGDVRGAGYFHAIELVKDKETKESFTDEESEDLLRGFLSGELYRRGLICRADDRGDPVIQLAPPLIADTRAVRGDRGRSCAPCSPRRGTRIERHRGTRQRGVRPMLTVHGLARRARARAGGRRGGRRAPGPLGAHHRAARPDAVAVRRRAAADHRASSCTTQTEQRRLRAPAVGPPPRRARLRHRLRARRHPAGARRRGEQARLPAVRGALRDAVHRDHREGVHAARQRAVRGAPARHRGARSASSSWCSRSAGSTRSRARSPAAIGGAVVVLDGRGEAMATRELPARAAAPTALDAIRAEARGAQRVGPRRRRSRPTTPTCAGRALALPGRRASRRAPAGMARRGPRRRRAGRLRAADPPAGGHGRGARADAPARRARHGAPAGRRRPGRGRRGRARRGTSCAGRLRPFGVGEQAAVLVFSLDDPEAAEAALDAALADAGSAGARRDAARACCARSSTARRRPGRARRRPATALARGARRRCGRRPAAPAPGRARCGAASTRRAARSRRPRCSTARAPEVASCRDLGAFQLLLSVQDDEALRLYCDSVLGPIENGEGEYGDELLRSLEAFIEQNGQWERAARELFCHRHTLRYRIRRVEQLTGRDLSSARDRIEFWLALRARELVA